MEFSRVALPPIPELY
jgi:hypothetical protein